MSYLFKKSCNPNNFRTWTTTKKTNIDTVFLNAIKLSSSKTHKLYISDTNILENTSTHMLFVFLILNNLPQLRTFEFEYKF